MNVGDLVGGAVAVSTILGGNALILKLLLDAKLDARLLPIEGRLGRIETHLDTIEERLFRHLEQHLD